MKKQMTRKQRIKRSNMRKAVVYYCIAKVFQILSCIGVLAVFCCLAADMRFSSLTSVVIGLVVGAVTYVVFNEIAHKITEYLYNHGYIKECAVIDSVTDWIQ